MRITIVLPDLGMAGGIRVLAIYAERLHRRGHQVTVVSLPKRQLGLRSKFRLFARDKKWPQHIKSVPSHFDGVSVPVRFLRSGRSVDEQFPDADVVLATFWRTGSYVAALSSKKGAKAILLQGYETSPGQWNTDIDAVWRLPFKKIVISKWLAQLARDRFGDENVDCVPNSVDTDTFHAPHRGKQLKPTVGFFYGILHLKGADVSLAALERLKQELANVRVIAFGADAISPEIPLPSWIEFYHRPSQDHIRELYSQCDVWLCGSRQEGFHLPPLEAMACRCPVVSTRVGGPLDIIEEGVNGFLVDVEDSASLAAKTLNILTMDEIEWCKLSNSALATALNYTWDDATELLERALRNAHDHLQIMLDINCEKDPLG